MERLFLWMPGLSMDNCMHSCLSPVPWSRFHDWGPDSGDGDRISFVDKLRDGTGHLSSDGNCVHGIHSSTGRVHQGYF